MGIAQLEKMEQLLALRGGFFDVFGCISGVNGLKSKYMQKPKALIVDICTGIIPEESNTNWDEFKKLLKNMEGFILWCMEFSYLEPALEGKNLKKVILSLKVCAKLLRKYLI